MAGVNRLCEEATALCQVLWCSYSHAYILLCTTCSCQWVPYPNVWGRPEIPVATGFARIWSFSRLIPDNRVRRNKHRQIQGLGALKPNARQQRRTESKEGAPGSEPLLSGQPSAMEIQASQGERTRSSAAEPDDLPHRQSGSEHDRDARLVAIAMSRTQPRLNNAGR